MAGLSTAKALGPNQVEVKVDSQIKVNQVIGAYTTKGKKLKKYLKQVLALRNQFTYFMVEHVPRANNLVANKLAKAA